MNSRIFHCVSDTSFCSRMWSTSSVLAFVLCFSTCARLGFRCHIIVHYPLSIARRSWNVVDFEFRGAQSTAGTSERRPAQWCAASWKLKMILKLILIVESSSCHIIRVVTDRCYGSDSFSMPWSVAMRPSCSRPIISILRCQCSFLIWPNIGLFRWPAGDDFEDRYWVAEGSSQTLER